MPLLFLIMLASHGENAYILSMLHVDKAVVAGYPAALRGALRPHVARQ